MCISLLYSLCFFYIFSFLAFVICYKNLYLSSLRTGFFIISCFIKVAKLDNQNESLNNAFLSENLFSHQTQKPFEYSKKMQIWCHQALIHLMKSLLLQNAALSFFLFLSGIDISDKKNNEITSITSAHKCRCLHPCCIMPFILFQAVDKSVSLGGCGVE